MKRTQIYLDEDLDRDLRRIAASEGRSAAALIRDAVRKYIQCDSPSAADEDPLLAAAGIFAGGASDSARCHDYYLYAETSAVDPEAQRHRMTVTSSH